MVKKLQKMAEKKAAAPDGLLDSQLAQTIKDSAQQIWLAGLGAFSKAQGERGKVFDTLIKEGVNLQRKTQAVAEEKLGDVAGKMTAMAGEVGTKANAHWDKLETIFEERTARALGRLGVPSAKELAALTARVDALVAAVVKLGGDPEPATIPKFRPGKALKDPANAAAPVKRKAAKAAAQPEAEPEVASAPTSAPAKPARKSARKAAAAPAEATSESQPAAASPGTTVRRRPTARAL
jgi:poly(hydroxyalkanoate) granule-associated protein